MPNKIAYAVDTRMVEGGQEVGILETTVQHGDGDAFSAYVDVVQTLPAETLYLLLPLGVAFAVYGVPGAVVSMNFLLIKSLLYTVGR